MENIPDYVWWLVLVVSILGMIFINYRQHEAAPKTIARKQAQLARTTDKVTKRIDGVVTSELRAVDTLRTSAERRYQALASTGVLPEQPAS